MDNRLIALALICIACAVVAGCTSGTGNAAPATPAATAVPVTTAAATPAATAPTPMNAGSCTVDEDCVPAECCHPKSCVNKVAQKPCDGIACTASCEGPLDCGAGTCGCTLGKCSVIAAKPTVQATKSTSKYRIWATQQRYSPIMSSTPGLEMSVISDIQTDTSTAEFDWSASYGQFLTWDPQTSIVNQVGPKTTTNGGKVYWSFTEKPTSTASPVIITVVVREVTGKELGRSTATLAWDGDNAVTVKEIV